MDAILNNSKRSMMPAGHHSDYDSTLLPKPKSSITWFGGIFARLPPLAAGLLTWKDHISKLSKTVGILYRIRHLLNRSALFILHCSLFLPYLTYCAEIWGNTYKSNTQCIFLLQKKIVRIVYGANVLEITPMLFFRI